MSKGSGKELITIALIAAYILKYVKNSLILFKEFSFQNTENSSDFHYHFSMLIFSMLIFSNNLLLNVHFLTGINDN